MDHDYYYQITVVPLQTIIAFLLPIEVGNPCPYFSPLTDLLVLHLQTKQRTLPLVENGKNVDANANADTDMRTEYGSKGTSYSGRTRVGCQEVDDLWVSLSVHAPTIQLIARLIPRSPFKSKKVRPNSPSPVVVKQEPVSNTEKTEATQTSSTSKKKGEDPATVT